MTGPDESANWLLLSVVYHRVWPRDGAAQIAIAEARRGGRLRMRAELREHMARPDIRLAPGEEPPPIPPKITPDYPILPTDRFEEWHWEYSRATRRDAETKSLFEYVNIVVHRDDVLACWPELAATGESAPAATVDLPRSEVQAGPSSAPTPVLAIRPALADQPKPDDITPLVWAVMKVLDAMRVEGVPGLGNMRKKELQQIVIERLWPDAKCSPKTLYKAECALRKRVRTHKISQF